MMGYKLATELEEISLYGKIEGYRTWVSTLCIHLHNDAGKFFVLSASCGIYYIENSMGEVLGEFTIIEEFKKALVEMM